MCRRKGTLHHFTTPDRFRRRADEADIQVYTFNRHNIRHMFCRTCGCAPFAEGQGPKGPMVEINLRCAEGIDLEALDITEFDGASLLAVFPARPVPSRPGAPRRPGPQ